MICSNRKKRKQQNIPRRKQMSRERRLASAKATSWIVNYTGKDIVKGYSNWYGVDLVCAIQELRLLGGSVSLEYEAQVRKSIECATLARKRRREKMLAPDESILSDLEAQFAFVAGYTPWGFPYGIPHGASTPHSFPSTPLVSAFNLPSNGRSVD